MTSRDPERSDNVLLSNITFIIFAVFDVCNNFKDFPDNRLFANGL